jgi:hypothetical protein
VAIPAECGARAVRNPSFVADLVRRLCSHLKHKVNAMRLFPSPMRLLVRLVLSISLVGTAAAQSPSATPSAHRAELPPFEALAAPLVVAVVERAAWQRATPEDAYRGVRTAQLRDDVDWILDGFADTDRAKVAGYLAKPDVRATNARIMKDIVSEEIRGRYAYKDHVILVLSATLASGKAYQRLVPMVRVAKGWSVSNALADDPMFAQLMK